MSRFPSWLVGCIGVATSFAVTGCSSPPDVANPGAVSDSGAVALQFRAPPIGTGGFGYPGILRAGPSADGSLQGTPSSMMSAPASAAACISRRLVSSSGSCPVR